MNDSMSCLLVSINCNDFDLSLIICWSLSPLINGRSLLPLLFNNNSEFLLLLPELTRCWRLAVGLKCLVSLVEVAKGEEEESLEDDLDDGDGE